ncbi:hypothetical protein MTR_7g063570 [Medicago truncatula]|uniref:Uncharacterized protein n=1 Tax=Medicago truncatula TaxID=3880 RepID=A0A072TZQ7_MEDTR|nr:hypothetical protein MTR_7g063570 [Medicago truncatula]
MDMFIMEGVIMEGVIMEVVVEVAAEGVEKTQNDGGLVGPHKSVCKICSGLSALDAIMISSSTKDYL